MTPWLVALLLAAPPRPAEGGGRNGRDGARPAEGGERARRDPEASPARDEEQPTLALDLSGVAVEAGCHVVGYEGLRRRLLGLQNQSQYMSLELWGDAEAYRPFQPVLFMLRAPRAAYVTLFWIGPEGHITVPFDNVRVPPERNVSIDSGGIIVPPLGKEQWVAIATLEPFPLACRDEAAMARALERRLAALHGVGRWEVKSAE